MKDYIKFILTYLLIVVITFTSFGITIHSHICAHTGKTYSSVVDDKACNTMQSEIQSSDNLSNKESCCLHSTDHCQISDISSNLKINRENCCADTTNTKILNIDYLLQNTINFVLNIEYFNSLNEIDNLIIAYNNDIQSKYKNLRQKLKFFTSFTLHLISILNNYSHRDYPEDIQIA